MYILVVNAGSSSIKYQLFNMKDQSVMAKGLCERIGLDGRLKHFVPGRPDMIADIAMPDHEIAARCVIDTLTSKEHGVIEDMHEINAVGHRIVSGGEFFTESVLVDDEVIRKIDICSTLAPLHNPGSIAGIRACITAMGPEVPQVVVFDTAFHQSMPPKSYVFPIPYKYYTDLMIRRYGAHGTSHRYVAERALAMLGRGTEGTKIVTCHLGNGSSITAVKDGRSFDTSMGLTPLDGILMGSRSGGIDPAIVGYISEREGKTASEVVTMLNKESGFLGISGVSSDLRDVEAAAAEGNERARLVVDILIHQIKRFIGGYAAAMGGLDAVVFTAGIGENNAELRRDVIRGLDFLGLGLDEAKNSVRAPEMDVSSADARAKTFVIATNEELMIASDTMQVVFGK